MSRTTRFTIHGAAFGLLVVVVSEAISDGLGERCSVAVMAIGMIAIGAASWGSLGDSRARARRP